MTYAPLAHAFQADLETCGLHTRLRRDYIPSRKRLGFGDGRGDHAKRTRRGGCVFVRPKTNLHDRQIRTQGSTSDGKREKNSVQKERAGRAFPRPALPFAVFALCRRLLRRRERKRQILPRFSRSDSDCRPRLQSVKKHPPRRVLFVITLWYPGLPRRRGSGGSSPSRRRLRDGDRVCRPGCNRRCGRRNADRSP